MKIETLVVPKGIRFLSDWKDYGLEKFPFKHILNKTITGCGFTEYCIHCNLNIILCSPRKILLENKEDQNSNLVFYARNLYEPTTNYEQDLTKEIKRLGISRTSFETEERRQARLKKEKELKEKREAAVLQLKESVINYWKSCQETPFNEAKPCKILVTYDSFRHVKEALGEDIDKFYVVIDEMQSIFVDSTFKSDSEVEFVKRTEDLEKVCFVSATPFMEKYLDMLNEFKDLPYYRLDWQSEQPDRVVHPKINIGYLGYSGSIQPEIKKVIHKYRSGKGPVYREIDPVTGEIKEIKSREAVIYVNSVKDICKAIKQNNLTLDECNVLVAKTDRNDKDLRKVFKIRKKKNVDFCCIGKVPGKNDPRKMFTFCTRTVYLGADFYSDNAQTFVFSNANIDSLSVDISMDLPQILGRQRLEENPWKREATVFITLKLGRLTKEIFEKTLEEKLNKTKYYLKLYDMSSQELGEEEKFIDLIDINIKALRYSKDYASIDSHSGKSPKLAFNNIVLVSDMRAFEVQQIDYANRFTVFSELDQQNFSVTLNNDKVRNLLSDYQKLTVFEDRMKFLYEVLEKNKGDEELSKSLVESFPTEFRSYFNVLSMKEIRSTSFRKIRLEAIVKSKLTLEKNTEQLMQKLDENFVVGKFYTKAIAKEILEKIFDEIGYKKTAKASLLSNWYKIQSTSRSDKDSGKIIYGILIISKL